jgi:reductive dehalogenase
VAPLVELFGDGRTGDVSPTRAPMPSDRAAVDNIKGYCFFLDADLVGIGRLADDHWTGPPIPGHTHAVSILVAQRRPIRKGEPGFDWIAGGAQTAVDMRAMEVATVVARYMATLGHSATAHTMATSDVDAARVAHAAGVVEVRGGVVSNPLIAGGYGLATITTSWALPADGAIAPRGRVEHAGLMVRHWLGVGGTRPGWRRLDGQNRPWHLGRYPMEKVRRVDEPTTLVIEDEVQRVPARHNFFVRARAGDLGPRPQQEVARFIPKAPHGMASSDMLNRMVPLQHGDAAPTVAPGTDDPDRNADAVKALGHFLGADMTGVCDAPSHVWYSHHPDGTEIEPKHRNAIVFVLDQGYETMEGASGDDWISGAQSMRAYLRSSMIACAMAAHLRSLGWAAQAHTARLDEVNHIPLLLRAGIGELSRIGELVLNPFVGPRFKSGVVTTDMPLTPDKPIDFGLQDFCGRCTKCARECPCGAIRFGDKTMFNGYEMWKPDVDRCARYRITNMRGSACGRCMKTCPYNVEGVLAERPFQWAAMNLPFTRSWIARFDDRLGRGSINAAKKWWVDIEMVNGTPVEPAKGANARDLNLDRKARDESGYAVFPPELAPPGPDGMARFPVDRSAGIAAAAAAERPDAARARLRRRVRR